MYWEGEGDRGKALKIFRVCKGDSKSHIGKRGRQKKKERWDVSKKETSECCKFIVLLVKPLYFRGM